MKDTAFNIGKVFMFVAAIVIFSPVAAFFGGVAGWGVGMIFGDVVLRFLSQIGITGFSMFQIGVCLGFCGSFLRTRTTVKHEKE